MIELKIKFTAAQVTAVINLLSRIVLLVALGVLS
jgi:hypothetical protein